MGVFKWLLSLSLSLSLGRVTARLKKDFKQFLVGALLLLGGSAIAGDVTGVTISSTMATQSTVTSTGGALFINLPVTHAAPDCGVPNNYRYAIKGTDKQMIAEALMAHATGKTVSIAGSGNCDAWGDTESVLYLLVH